MFQFESTGCTADILIIVGGKKLEFMNSHIIYLFIPLLPT